MKTNYLVTILSLLIVLSACSGGEEVSQETEELVKTVNVRTLNISPAEFNSYVRVVGTVKTSDDILISAEVSGKVLRYNVKEGSAVRAGQTILSIDDSKLKQEAARLEAVTNQAKENFERLEKIYKEEGIGSEIEYLNAKYAYEQNASSLESIKVDLANTKIKAPFNGVVEEILFEVGEMVSPGAPTVRLIGAENFKITAGVPARYANAISRGDQVSVWFDTQDADTLLERINFVGNSINPQNRTFRIEIDMTRQEEMKVDMITNIRLKTMQQNDVIVVSEEFIYSKDGRYVAYVLSKNDEGKAVAQEKEVTLGASYQSNVIVESGLAPGDELITIGSAFLNNGMRINVVESQSAIAAQ